MWRAPAKSLFSAQAMIEGCIALREAPSSEDPSSKTL
jgi:hypothetical protein